MTIAFIAAFIVAVIFLVFNFIVMEDDLRRKSERPLLLLLIAGSAWFMSLLLVGAQATTTTTIPAYNITTYVTGNVVSVISYPTQMLAVTENKPFPEWMAYTYWAFSAGMSVICILLFIQYNLRLGAAFIIGGMKDLTG